VIYRWTLCSFTATMYHYSHLSIKRRYGVLCMNDNVAILFTRIPVPGRTKTRLMPFLDGEECAKLHSAFLSDIYNQLKESIHDFDIAIFYAPDGNVGELIALLPGAVAYVRQYGDSLGDKMHNAISEMLAGGYKKCILLGSDIPLLSADVIDKSFARLTDNDIVLCPTEDGGYYLVGMKQPCFEIFDLDTFGVSSVLERTLAAANEAGKKVSIGSVTMDIDEPEDLRRLAGHLENESADICRETRKVLKHLPQFSSL